MSWIITGKEAGSLGLLDQYGGAAAAYSLRNLSVYYTDPVVRVRRSSDNTEQDFTATQVTDGTLTTFCGAGNGFVRTWYDQSGNSNQATQSTVSLQPRIVNSGTLETVNGEPAIYTNLTADDSFGLTADIDGFQSLSNLSVFAQITPINAASSDQFNNLGIFQFGDPTIPNALMIADATGLLSGETVVIYLNNSTSRRLGSSTYARASNTQSLFSSFHLATGTGLYVNGGQISLNLTLGMTTSTPAAPKNTGYVSDNLVQLVPNSGDGRPTRMQEFIFYPSDQSTNRTAIEANINAHYSIF